MITNARAIAATAQRSLAEAVSSVDTAEGRQRVRNYLAKKPFPHFEAIAGAPGSYRRVEADGQQSVGRFVDGQFQVVDR